MRAVQPAAGSPLARAFSAALGAAVLAAAGCRPTPEREDAPYTAILHFDTAAVRLAGSGDTVVLTLELAVNEDQHRLGLMERRQLPERAGMLFVYDSTQPPNAGFWMYRTRIPLDIAFLDSGGLIRSIRRMTPCEAVNPGQCPSYLPGTPYRFALELNAGVLQRIGADTGARLLVSELPAQ
jgi:uncharacterized membrane protein (UPF0127 family)